jgi:hypothetical protein
MVRFSFGSGSSQAEQHGGHEYITTERPDLLRALAFPYQLEGLSLGQPCCAIWFWRQGIDQFGQDVCVGGQRVTAAGQANPEGPFSLRGRKAELQSRRT